MANITINATPSRAQYSATSGQTEFAVPFPFNANADLKVYQRATGSTADDAADLLTITTEYTVTGAGEASGGTVTLISGATLGDIITIIGDEAVDRDTIINSASKLTSTTLNTQFNDLVIFTKQIETKINQLMLAYNNNESVDTGYEVDNRLPLLTPGTVWRKNDGDTAIELATLPTYPIGSTGGNFSQDNRLTKTDTSGSQNNLQLTGITVDDSDNITGIQNITVNNVQFPTNSPTTGQVIKATSTTTTEWTDGSDGDVDGPASATDNAYARFDGTSGKQLQNSLTTEDDSGNVVFAGTVTLNQTPTGNLEAATKSYVDATSAAREWKNSVLAASTAALTVTYDNGAAGVGATLTNAGAQVAFSLDGQSPTVDDRVLIKNQASAFQNGIYVVTTVGDGLTNWVLTRAIDHDIPDEMEAGVALNVDAGTVNALRIFVQTSTVTTVGTDAVDFAQFGATGDVVGPASATDEALARFDTTTGKLIQNSAATLSDAGLLSTADVQVANLTASNFVVTDASSNLASQASIAVSDLSTGTDGELITWDASGNPATVAVGTSGQVLTSNGAGAAPTFQDAAGGPSAATQAEMEAGTATDVYVSPGRQQYHESAVKFWVTFDGTGTAAIGDSYNITSLADNGTGRYTLTITTNFSDAEYATVAMGGDDDAVDQNVLVWTNFDDICVAGFGQQ